MAVPSPDNELFPAASREYHLAFEHYSVHVDEAYELISFAQVLLTTNLFSTALQQAPCPAASHELKFASSISIFLLCSVVGSSESILRYTMFYLSLIPAKLQRFLLGVKRTRSFDPDGATSVITSLQVSSRNGIGPLSIFRTS